MNTKFTFAFRRIAALLVLTVALTVGASRSMAQVTIYARFLTGNPPWNGESTAAGRAGWTELKSISLGAAAEVTVGSGGTVGRLVFDPIVITKLVDRLTPQIFANMASGQSLNAQTTNGDLTIEFVKPVGGTPTVVFRVEMKLVFFTSTASTTATGDDTVCENVRMVCGAQRITTVPIVGGIAQPSVIQSWSQVLNNSNF